jgi:FKBP-type peptidyl-prolyl cis-trans isomerase
MKKSVILAAVILGLLLAPAFAQDKAAAAAPAPAKEKSAAKLNDDNDRFSYAIGMQIGMRIRESGLPASGIKLDVFTQAMQDMFADREPALTTAEVQKAMQDMNTKMTEKNKGDGEKFLAENAKKPGVKTTASGLQYEVVKEGDGPSPTATDRVKVHYTGTLVDGKKFDSSVDRGQPAEFGVGEVIKGWTEGLQLMKKGAKYRFVIPSALGYGEKGNRMIPGNSVLVFDVELIDILPAAAAAKNEVQLDAQPKAEPAKKK